MKKVNLIDAKISLFLEIDGVVHLVTMEEDKLETIKTLTKLSTKVVIPTKRTQSDLENFVGFKRE